MLLFLFKQPWTFFIFDMFVHVEMELNTSDYPRILVFCNLFIWFIDNLLLLINRLKYSCNGIGSVLFHNLSMQHSLKAQQFSLHLQQRETEVLLEHRDLSALIPVPLKKSIQGNSTNAPVKDTNANHVIMLKLFSILQPLFSLHLLYV